MDNRSLLLWTLTVMMLGTVISLAWLKEARIDVYISLFTVEYYAASALIRVRRRTVDLVGLTLLAAFARIVALRIMELLFKG